MKKAILLLVVFIVIANIFAFAGNKHKKHHWKPRWFILKGSRHSQLVQNQEADKEGLSRIKNDRQLCQMKKNHLLVPITKKVEIDHRLKKKFRYVRPWTNEFMAEMAIAFKKRFGSDEKIRVNSAVRTIASQCLLRRRNCNAAKISGPTASSHLTGATVDIAKRNLDHAELEWVMNYLANAERRHEIEVTEEHRQPVFHFMVFK